MAEVPLGNDGGFRFFAAPGSWTLRVLAPGGRRGERSVQADYGQVTKADLTSDRGKTRSGRGRPCHRTAAAPGQKSGISGRGPPGAIGVTLLMNGR